jgi:hypothetical protein
MRQIIHAPKPQADLEATSKREPKHRRRCRPRHPLNAHIGLAPANRIDQHLAALRMGSGPYAHFIRKGD